MTRDCSQNLFLEMFFAIKKTKQKKLPTHFLLYPPIPIPTNKNSKTNLTLWDCRKDGVQLQLGLFGQRVD